MKNEKKKKKKEPIPELKVITILVVLGGLITFVATHFGYLPHDGMIEETIENVIEVRTGADIDLSPDSPE